jgi:hypothetical protein
VGTFHKDLCTFMICCWILLRMRSVWDKSGREKQNIHFLHSITFSKNGATYDNIIWCICFACCITKAADTHAEYVILIAFPRQQLLRKCTSMLRLNIRGLSCYLLPVNTVNWLYHSAFSGMLREKGFKPSHPKSDFLK